MSDTCEIGRMYLHSGYMITILKLISYNRSMMMFLLNAIISFLLLFPSNVYSDIYKYTDKSGVVHLTNVTCTYEEFDLNDFKGSYNIDTVCTLLKVNIPSLAGNQSKCTLEWLNKLISQPSLYNEVINDDKTKTYGMRNNKYIMDFFQYTESLRLGSSREKKIAPNCINNLNRLILKTIFPNEIPPKKIELVLTMKEKIAEKPESKNGACWVSIGGSKDMTWYYDAERIKFLPNNIIRVWVKTSPNDEDARLKVLERNEKRARKFGIPYDEAKYANYAYTTTLYAINCKDNTQDILASSDYNDESETISSVKVVKKDPVYVIPDFIAEFLNKTICSLKDSKKKSKKGR